jgi:hypothetical protein
VFIGQERIAVGVLQRLLVCRLRIARVIWKIRRAEEYVQLLVQLPSQVIFHVGIRPPRRAGRQPLGVRLGPVAVTDDMHDCLTGLDLLLEHVAHGAIVRREVGLLDRMAVDRQQGLFHHLTD